MEDGTLVSVLFKTNYFASGVMNGNIEVPAALEEDLKKVLLEIRMDKYTGM